MNCDDHATDIYDLVVLGLKEVWLFADHGTKG